MVPLIGFIVLVIDLYIWVVIASAILSWLVAFNVVNTNNRVVLIHRRHAVPLDGAGASADPQHPAQSRRHRHLARDPDPVPVVHPRRRAARLAHAGGRSHAVALPPPAPLGPSLRRSRDGVIIAVRLTPKAARDEIVGIEDFGGEAVLKARVRALPECWPRQCGARNPHRALAQASALHRECCPWRQVAAEAGRRSKAMPRRCRA